MVDLLLLYININSSIENYCDSLEDYAVYPNTSFKTPEKVKKIPQCCIEKFAEELQ